MVAKLQIITVTRMTCEADLEIILLVLFWSGKLVVCFQMSNQTKQYAKIQDVGLVLLLLLRSFIFGKYASGSILQTFLKLLFYGKKIIKIKIFLKNS